MIEGAWPNSFRSCYHTFQEMGSSNMVEPRRDEVVRLLSNVVIYQRSKSWKRSIYYVGQDEDHPLLAITDDCCIDTPRNPINHNHLANVPRNLVIHSSADSDAPPLVASAGECLTLHTDPIQIIDGSKDPEVMTLNGLRFALDIGATREKFEWRRSHGKEVRALHPYGNAGLKLVRLQHVVGSGGERYKRDMGQTSDGLEVVAVWTEFKSSSDILMFRLLGSAASGELGDCLPLVALLTGMKFQLYNPDT